MVETKISGTVAEAQVGDLLWLCDPEANRYDAGGKYRGRGIWKLVTVVSVGRLSVEAGNPEYPQNAGKYDRKTGAMRTRSGYSGFPYLRGSVERAAEWWDGQRYALADRVKTCRDLEVMKTIAFALGIEGPPDFTGIPTPSPAPLPQGVGE